MGNRINCQLRLNRCGDHILQQNLERHGVSASFVGKEELAVALEFTICKRDLVIVVIAVEGQFELIEAKTGTVFRVALGFFQFSDQSIVHR